MNALASNKIKIDIVSDLVCPWCIIGYKRLALAISELGMEDRVDIEWQPFELNPDMPSEGMSIREYMVQSYGISLEEIKMSHQKLMGLGAELGFKFNFHDEMKVVNTRDAHVASELAKELGKQTEVKLALYEAHFAHGKDISDHKVITQIFAQIGLSTDELQARLGNKEWRKKVQANEAPWLELGVEMVPTMIFNQKQQVIGDQPIAAYKEALRRP